MFLTGTNIIFRLRCSCAERCRIGWVVLLALFHEGSDCLRCDQFHLVSKTGQDPCPVMRCTARLHGDDAPLLLLEERDQFTPSQLAPDLHLSGLIHAVHLEDGLGGVQADHGNAHRGRLLFYRFSRPVLWHTDAVWGRPPHLSELVGDVLCGRSFAPALRPPTGDRIADFALETSAIAPTTAAPLTH